MQEVKKDSEITHIPLPTPTSDAIRTSVVLPTADAIRSSVVLPTTLVEDKQWTLQIEQALEKTKGQCQSYKWMHNRQSDRYLEIHKWLKAIVVFLILLTTGGFFGTASFGSSSVLWVRILLGGLGLVTAYLARRYGEENYALQSWLHKNAAADWGWTYQTIDNELTSPRQNRQLARDLKRWIDSRILSQLKHSPDISAVVLRQYRRVFPSENQAHVEEILSHEVDLEKGLQTKIPSEKNK